MKIENGVSRNKGGARIKEGDYLHKGHLFSAYSNKKWKGFLPLDTHTYMCVSRGEKYYFFENFWARTKWMIPNYGDHSFS